MPLITILIRQAKKSLLYILTKILSVVGSIICLAIATSRTYMGVDSVHLQSTIVVLLRHNGVRLVSC
jgi:hypothetical protein